MDLGYNEFTGFLPADTANLTFLETLMLSGTNFNNSLFGVLPKSLTKLVITFHNAGMMLPEEIGELTDLMDFVLDFSDLYGTIPSELGRMTSLTSLSFFTNALTGTIPTEIGLLSKLVNFDVEDNQLEGRIPDELFLLSDISNLYLNGNKNVTGVVPDEFCDLGLTNFIVDCPTVTCSCCDCT